MHFIGHGLQRLGREGSRFFENSSVPLKSGTKLQKSLPSPTNVYCLVLLMRYLYKFSRKIVRKIFLNEDWALAYKFGKIDPFKPLNDFAVLKSPKGTYWADPFPVERDGRFFVFFEEFVYAKGRAHISVLEINPNNHKITESTPVVERDYHLSYPFILEDEGSLYMIPESSERNTVELYQCVKFPYEWKFEKNLLEGIKAADATIVKHDNRWWMFANVTPKGAFTSDQLHIFYADHLKGPWVHHQENPVLLDARWSRPAGKFFSTEENLYRVSQDCFRVYGRAIMISKVLELSVEHYVEERIKTIEPDWFPGIQRVHTLNRSDGLTMIDGFFTRFRWR